MVSLVYLSRSRPIQNGCKGYTWLLFIMPVMEYLSVEILYFMGLYMFFIVMMDPNVDGVGP